MDWQKALSDYSQLLEGYPNAKRFAQALRGNIEQNVPSQADFESPEAMSQWSQSAALNAPMGLAIKAYHGTPHSFDKFDMSKIGTGEGAQAYGHGLYFAESPAVAEEYMKVDPSTPLPPRRLFQGQELKPGTPEYHAARLVQDTPLLKARKEVQGWIDEISGIPERAKDVEGYRRTLEILNQATSKKDFKTAKPKPNLYNVSLEWPDAAREAVDPLSPEHFLDWDKPLMEQSPEIKQGIMRSGLVGPKHNIENDDYLAGNFVKNLLPEHQQLLYTRGGIPGIRYLDRSSRGAGEGTSNYVVFSDQIPRIVEKLRGN